MLFALLLTLATPIDWTPARWRWTDPQSLELLAGSPVNCLLVPWSAAPETAAFPSHATRRGIATLAVIVPGEAVVESAQAAKRAGYTGIALEGDFPDGLVERVRDSTQILVVEITSRGRLKLGGAAPIVATYQGVWPGIHILDNGAVKGGPTGGPWIDTNSGFLRSARAWGDAAVWIANQPPAKTVIKGDHYLHAICDAAMTGARWVLALDDDFAARLRGNDQSARKDWRRMLEYLRFFEDHKPWRSLQPFGKLALVQEPGVASLLSGGILDMIAVKHTPVRPVPRQRLSLQMLRDAKLAVNVDGDGLTPEQREVLRSFTRSGGTLLTGPPGWKGPAQTGQITLDEAELNRLNEIWKEVNGLIGRGNHVGARLFNVSTLLTNLLTTPDSRQVLVHLVNYSDYPVESIAIHLAGKFARATLVTPDGRERALEVYPTDDGVGVDIDRFSVYAALRLESTP